MPTLSTPVCLPGDIEAERWPRALRLLEFPKLLASLASRAASEPGRAACLRLTPATDPADAGDRLALMADVLRLTAEVRLVLPDFPDIAPVFPKIDATVPNLDLDDLFAVRLALDAAGAARETILDASSGPQGRSGQAHPGQDRFGRLAGLAREARVPEKSAAALKRCLTAEGALRDEASPELYSVRQSIRAIHQRCAKRAKDFVQAESVAPFLQDDFLTISADRYVLPVKSDFKGRVQGIVHDYSQTGETVYVEPYFLVDVNNQLQELRREEREEERKVVAFLAGLLASESDQARGLFDFLVRLDVLLAAADLSAAYDGALVEVAPGLPLTLRAARHPLLALDPQTRVAPVDLLLREGERGLIVSGGNAGGKTVCLKTLGLVALMAQSGLPVPVQEGGTLPFFREFFVFIGDEQSLEAHLSTFTGQIDYLSRVWERVGDGCLAILDEFGAGTDPAQGAALAEAVIDSLLERGATVAAATHFPALKVWGMTREGVRAASVIFDPASKRPLYALAYDQVGASLALEAARDHGLPAEILQKAETILRVGGGETSAVLDRLNRLAAEREAELATMRKEANALKGERKSLKDRFEKERQRITDEVRGLSGEIMAKWRTDKLGRKEAQKKLADLREKVRVFDPAAGIPGAAGSAASAASDIRPEALPGWVDFVNGARMTYAPWSKPATVLGVDEKRGQVKLDLGGVALWVKPEELRFPAGTAAKTKVEGTGVGPSAPESPKAPKAPGQVAESLGFRLDVRGLRADEAGREVERALDKALLRGLSGVEIVHGKGTGALRREIHEFLRTSPAVAGFQLATEEFGGDGVTVVELR